MTERKRLGEILIEACLINQEQLDEALHLQKRQNRLIGQILVDMGWVTENEVCRAVSELLNIKYVEVEDALISQEIVQLAPKELAAKRNILPLFIQDRTLYLAMENPLDIDVIQRIEFRTGMQVRPLIAPPSQLRETVRKHYNVEEYIGNMLKNVVEKDAVNIEGESEIFDDSVDISEMKKASEGGEIVKLTNLIISEGIKKRASDIHIEPSQHHATVRYRIDGLLTKGARVAQWFQLPLVSRIKVLSGMNIAERRKPQDGRMRIKFARRKIDLRISTLPTNFGEKVVIRILDSKTSSHDLTRLGLSENRLKMFQAMLKQPQGWILVTGPTGSGKTTTLYASLNAIKDVTKNIVTIEDPIEYQLEGIIQVQVNPKADMTFASGLRSILRQDPNVILVGEIRDPETAGIAMQASETGHLVLSTLHTNDSVSTVDRLFNLGISSDLVASNLLVVIAQRLVRRICPRCKAQYTPDAQELHQIGLSDAQPSAFIAYKGSGCPTCNHTGYYGQTGVYELFVPNDRLRAEIAKRPSKQVLKQLAIEAGMKTMLEDGIEKIHQGITTIEEVARVCYVEQDELGEKIECPECGKTLANAENICPFCQSHLHEFCEQCWVKLEKDWLFCPFCGAKKADILKPTLSPGESSPQKQGFRIVAADDEETVRDMVQLLLETHGYQVIPAIDGEDALEKIRSELPDMAILDVVMPKQDGFSVCKALRSNVETMFMPVVMLTAQDSIEEKLRGLSAGADEYITKPFDINDLLSRVETLLHQPHQIRNGENYDA